MADDAFPLPSVKIDAGDRRVSLPALLKGLAEAGYNDVVVKVGRVSIRASRQPSVNIGGPTVGTDPIDDAFGEDDDED